MDLLVIVPAQKRHSRVGMQRHSSFEDFCRYDAKKPDDEDESHVEGAAPDGDGEFGFVTLDRTHTLTSFEAYAHWAKRLHFGIKAPNVSP